jgi:hypothetical protein
MQIAMPPSAKTTWINHQYSVPVDGSVECQIILENGSKCKQKFGVKSQTHMREHLFQHPSTKRHLNNFFKDFGKDSQPNSNKSIKPSLNAMSSIALVDLTSDSKKRRYDECSLDSTTNQSNSRHCSGCQCAVDQSTLMAGFQRHANLLLEPACAKAWAECSLAYSLIEAKAFVAFLDAVRASKCPYPTRHSIPRAQAKCAAELKKTIFESIRTQSKLSPVTVATDGWTNVCGIKVTNVLVLIGGVAFYWYSLYSEDGNTAIDMAPLVAAVIDELLDEGVAVVGLVADNEAVNGAVHRLLNDDFPWLVEVGCASHTSHKSQTTPMNLTFSPTSQMPKTRPIYQRTMVATPLLCLSLDHVLRSIRTRR